MSLLAEELVEEWLNRLGWFTMRGVKVGVDEIDLLAVKWENGSPCCRHIEVQASTFPISYITSVPKKMREQGVTAHNAKKRNPVVLEQGVEEWIEKKFNSPTKVAFRRSLVDAEWTRELVVLNVKHPNEVGILEKKGVAVLRLRAILQDLRSSTGKIVKRATGGDLVDLILTDYQ